MKDSFQSGMRGGEKPKEKPKAKVSKNVRSISTEKAANGGFITKVEHHPPKLKSNGKGDNQLASSAWHQPAPHAHSTKEEALAHHSSAMEQMATPQEYDGEDGE